ncbi:MAG: glucose-1-phosphate adenylyltransferase [Opitutae bacterium]
MRTFPRVICIIMGGGRGSRLYPLTKDRCKPAVPLAGNYRLVDIPISNCLNSGFNQIFVLTQFNTASLHKHIQQTYKFDGFARGFVDILAAEQTGDSEAWYQGTADAVRQNLHHYNLKDEDLVLILSGDQLYRLDFAELAKQHIESAADITIAAKAMPAEQVSALGVMRVGSDLKITEFVEKPKDPAVIESLVLKGNARSRLSDKSDRKYCLASMGIYMFSGKMMREALADPKQTDFGKEVIPGLLASKRMISYVFDGYWEDIGTVGSFWECNLTLTDPVPPFDFFDSENPIYTHASYLPTAKLNGCRVNKALMAGGSIVDDSVITRSVIGIRSVIRGGSTLENVVMMGADSFERPQDLLLNHNLGRPDIGVGANCLIRNAIIDKNARIGAGCRLAPTGLPEKWETDALFVRDGVIVVKKGAVVPPGTIVGE